MYLRKNHSNKAKKNKTATSLETESSKIIKWQQRDANPQTLSSWTNTQPFRQTGLASLAK